MASEIKSAFSPCARPLCQDPGADADHVIVFGRLGTMRLPVCAMCAVDAQLQGIEAHALAFDEDWSKINAEAK